MNGDDDGDWHDQQPVILAAGAAALVLVAILVWAVINTSENARVPDAVPFAPSSATSSTYTTKSTTSTSYTVPSVQTSQYNPVVPAPPPSTSADDDPADAETAPTTTIYNPYLTTTPTNAGHI